MSYLLTKSGIEPGKPPILPDSDKKWRRTGLKPLITVPWGSHFCQLFQSRDALLQTLALYFRTGLEENEKCVWVVGWPLGAEEAGHFLMILFPGVDAFLESGQMEILPYRRWSGLLANIRNSRKSDTDLYGNYSGLRIGSNACCGHLAGSCPSDNLIEYEIELDWLVKRRHVLAFCAYHLANHTTGSIINLSTSHGSILLEENGRWRVFENSRWGQIHHLYENGATYTEVGRRLGISRERVRQLLVPARKKTKPSTKKNAPVAQILSASQVSRLLNIHINTVRRWSENGTLPAFRIGNRGDRRFYLKDIERFIRNGNRQTSQ